MTQKLLNRTTGAQLIQDIRTEARIYPDNRSACYYLRPLDHDEADYEDLDWDDPGQIVPCCIVGRALVRAGVPKEFFKGATNSEVITAASFHHALGVMGFTITEREWFWLGSVQRSQDESYTWGEAVKIADKETALHG